MQSEGECIQNDDRIYKGSDYVRQDKLSFN